MELYPHTINSVLLFPQPIYFFFKLLIIQKPQHVISLVDIPKVLELHPNLPTVFRKNSGFQIIV